MAKALNVSKGGITVNGAVLRVFNVRFADYIGPAGARINEWSVEWRLFTSQEEADKAVAGMFVAQGMETFPYVAGQDPVQQTESLALARLPAEWDTVEVV